MTLLYIHDLKSFSYTAWIMRDYGFSLTRILAYFKECYFRKTTSIVDV